MKVEDLKAKYEKLRDYYHDCFYTSIGLSSKYMSDNDYTSAKAELERAKQTRKVVDLIEQFLCDLERI